jgi:hypothetical protein
MGDGWRELITTVTMLGWSLGGWILTGHYLVRRYGPWASVAVYVGVSVAILAAFSTLGWIEFSASEY